MTSLVPSVPTAPDRLLAWDRLELRPLEGRPMQLTAEQIERERRAKLMCSFRGRLRLAREAAAAEEAAQKNSLQNDPWFAPTGRLKGRVDWDGWEYIESQQIMDVLEVPMHARRGGLFRRLTKLMSAH